MSPRPAHATLHFVTARNVAVRWPCSSISARSPRTAPGPELGHDLAVDLDREHAVEDEVQLLAGVALLGERLAPAELLHLGLDAAPHDLHRQLPLERRLDRSRERGRLLVAPRRMLPERVPVPGLELDEAGLLDQLPVTVVDPVAGERAAAGQLPVARAVGVDGELERGPRGGRLDLHERRVRDPAGRGRTGLATRGLGERDRTRGLLGLLAQVRERGRGERHVVRPELQGGRADAAAAGVAVVDDLVVDDVDPGPQLVREPELVTRLEDGEVLDLVRRRVVVVGDPHGERELRRPADRLGRDPRDRGDRRLDAHCALLCSPADGSSRSAGPGSV